MTTGFGGFGSASKRLPTYLIELRLSVFGMRIDTSDGDAAETGCRQCFLLRDDLNAL